MCDFPLSIGFTADTSTIHWNIKTMQRIEAKKLVVCINHRIYPVRFASKRNHSRDSIVFASALARNNQGMLTKTDPAISKSGDTPPAWMILLYLSSKVSPRSSDQQTAVLVAHFS